MSSEVPAPDEARTPLPRQGGGGPGGGIGSGVSAVSRLPERLYAARMRARERWRRLAVTVTVTIVSLALMAYVIVWHTSLFAVTAVRIVGAKRVTVERIAAASNVSTGSAIASVDTSGAIARLEKLPEIASARVSLDWPHTVVISVVERLPAALIPDGANYDVVDVSGVVFGSLSTPGKELPVINVQGGAAMKSAVVPGALAALKALPADITGRITGISASSTYSITLNLRGGAVVDWGSGQDPDAKAADLEAMLRLRKAARYDVSAPKAPAMS
jgi:cell division protein FtsQ